jgi:hypothetical protein
MWHIADVSADHHCNPTDGLQRHSVVITAVTDPGALHRQARPHSPHRTAPHRTAPHRTAPHRTDIVVCVKEAPIRPAMLRLVA